MGAVVERVHDSSDFKSELANACEVPVRNRKPARVRLHVEAGRVLLVRIVGLWVDAKCWGFFDQQRAKKSTLSAVCRRIFQLDQ